MNKNNNNEDGAIVNRRIIRRKSGGLKLNEVNLGTYEDINKDIEKRELEREKKTEADALVEAERLKRKEIEAKIETKIEAEKQAKIDKRWADMKRWEYKSIYRSDAIFKNRVNNNPNEEIEAVEWFNELGRDGWELVSSSITSSGYEGNSIVTLSIFKREL